MSNSYQKNYQDLNSVENNFSTSSKYSQKEEPKQSTKIIQLTYVVVPLMILISIIFYASRDNGQMPNNSSDIGNSMSKLDSTIHQAPLEKSYGSNQELEIYATNEYGHYDTTTYPFFADFPGSQLVEPYKETTLTLKGDESFLEGCDFVWTLHGDSNQYKGRSITITRSAVGVYAVAVEVYNSKDGGHIITYKTKLIVKYVKRDMRTLTIADRERFLNAAHKMWEYGTPEGRSIYGNKFTGIHTYVKEHAVASGDIMCDQFHEGSGFMTHHFAMSNSFETSMRAIDPSVTLPYWDFSVEGQRITSEGKAPSYLVQIAEVFSDKWFGEVDSENHISNSRWAHSAMPKTETYDDNKNTSQNSYGFIRSYWNNNPDSEVVRHMFDICGIQDEYKIIPDCSVHYSLINSDNLAQFQLLSPTDGHGPVHVQIGGMFGGCTEAYHAFVAKWGTYLDETLGDEQLEAMGLDSTEFKNKWGETSQRRIMFNKVIIGEYFHIYRGLWRSHMCTADNTPALLECPEKCSLDTSFDDCTCSVNKLKTGETTWQNLLPCFLNTEDNRNYFNKTMSEEFMVDVINMVATAPVKEGEMLHSASPADILFWIIHPVIERLLAAKRLSTVTTIGGATFSKWSDSVSTDKNEWLSYSYYNLAKGSNKYYPEEYTCKGHAADDNVLPDRLPLSNHIMGAADANKDGKVSNWEFYLALDPNNVYTSDYVFDHFEWKHCEGVLTDSKSVEGTTQTTNLAKRDIY